MLASQIPTRIAIQFAASAGSSFVSTIPATTAAPGRASFTAGFPPANFLPDLAGGINPDGRDFNGILQACTAWLQWQNAGGIVGYDAAFSTAIGGYPAGAILARNPAGGLWLSTVDNNTTDPDTGGAGWVALFKPSLVTFAMSGTWTVPAWVTRIQIPLAVGGGAGGGGCGATSVGEIACGSGGASGAVSSGFFDVTPGAVLTVTIGAGGAGGVGAANGAAGGTTSVAGLLSAPGGSGGFYSTSTIGPVIVPGGQGAAAGTGGSLNLTGCNGDAGFIMSASNGLGGAGKGIFGTLGGVSTGGNGGAGATPGAGGGGASIPASTSAANGGAGAAGLVTIVY